MTAQELKNSILMRAVSGKLVSQNPDDEPASVLLAKIRAEKEQMMKEGKIKKAPISEIYVDPSDNQHYEKIGKTVKCIEDEIPFEIPEGWAWCRLNDLFSMQAGKNISASNIHENKSELTPYLCYGGNGIRGYVDRYNQEGTYPLIGRQGALCGNVKRANGRFYATEHAVVVSCFSETNIDWACLFLEAMNLNQYATATAQPGLAVSKIIMTFIPVPPVAEQIRIVQKAQRMIPFIKEYDIVENKLKEFNSELNDNLKRSLLQYAIQGKLVSQNPDDEPASVLLERIRAEKEELIKDGKLKRSKNESYIYRDSDNSYYERIGTTERCIDDEIPFEIPESWEWCRLGSTGFIVRGNGIKRNETTPSGVKCVRYGELYTTYNYIFQETISYVPQELADKCKHIKYGDALFTLTGENKQDIGKAIVYVGNEDAVIGGDLAQFTKHLFEPLFLAYLLNSPYVVFQKSTVATGDIIVHISGDKLANLLIALPPQMEQKRIAKKITEINTLLG